MSNQPQYTQQQQYNQQYENLQQQDKRRAEAEARQHLSSQLHTQPSNNTLQSNDLSATELNQQHADTQHNNLANYMKSLAAEVQQGKLGSNMQQAMQHDAQRKQ